MAKLLRLRRGTDTQHTTFTGAEGEVTVNTTNDSLHVHDGTTAGGRELMRADKNNMPNSGVAAGTYGSSSAIPSITVDAKGLVTSATTSAIDSTAITNGTSNVSVAASGNITATRAGTTRLTVNSTGIDVSGNITVSGTVDGRDVATDGTKLDGIAAGAQVNVGTNLGKTTTTTTNVITSSTGTNVTLNEATGSAAGLMSTAHHNKLDGIESGATADQSASEILTLIKTVDGSGSGLDADTLDGQHASAFANPIKKWVKYTSSGSIVNSSGVSSLGWTGDRTVTVNFSSSFSNTSYGILDAQESGSGAGCFMRHNSTGTSSWQGIQYRIISGYQQSGNFGGTFAFFE